MANPKKLKNILVGKDRDSFIEKHWTVLSCKQIEFSQSLARSVSKQAGQRYLVNCIRVHLNMCIYCNQTNIFLNRMSDGFIRYKCPDCEATF
jgi:capsule polysaccharide export protein KpsC/LpsZ